MGEPGSSALATVLAHPRFFRIERIHGGHTRECPEHGFVDEYGLKVCWHWQVGVAILEGRVDWYDGFTCQEAVDSAAEAIKRSPHE